MPCADGTFSNQTGLTECYDCPAGYYCMNEGDDDGDGYPDGIVSGTICPRGRYCPGSTNATIPKCPIGTYNAQYGMISEDDCIPCRGKLLLC